MRGGEGKIEGLGKSRFVKSQRETVRPALPFGGAGRCSQTMRGREEGGTHGKKKGEGRPAGELIFCQDQERSFERGQGEGRRERGTSMGHGKRESGEKVKHICSLITGVKIPGQKAIWRRMACQKAHRLKKKKGLGPNGKRGGAGGSQMIC